jgi:hypothetical protein
MSVIDNAKEHFKAKLGGDLQKVTIREWKTDVYYKPAYSFAVESKILELQQKGKVVEALVESIIQKALTPEGKPMFNSGDKWSLMNEVDPSVITKIASAINSATLEIDAGAVEKN